MFNRSVHDTKWQNNRLKMVSYRPLAPYEDNNHVFLLKAFLFKKNTLGVSIEIFELAIGDIDFAWYNYRS